MANNNGPSAFSKDPLNDEENQYARWMQERDKRKQWFYGWLYRLAIAGGAVAGAVAAVRTFIGGFL